MNYYALKIWGLHGYKMIVLRTFEASINITLASGILDAEKLEKLTIQEVVRDKISGRPGIL